MKKIITFIIIFLILIGGNSIMSENSRYKKALFAGGCFWCMEAAFKDVNGVIDVFSCYTGGHKENPTYEDVLTGTTGHYEAVEVIYDSEIISYYELLKIYWMNIDPTDPEGQFADRGLQYRTAIFYFDEEQRRIAEKSKRELEKSGKFNKPIVTEIKKAGKVYKAEEYHQNYCNKHPVEYKSYSIASGRIPFILKIWGKRDEEPWKNFKKPDEYQLRMMLTPLQYHVTQENGTEPPFNNEYYKNKEEGIYVDIVSGEPLFSSLDKYDSGSGWPSFKRALEKDNIITRVDKSHGMVRIEVRSKYGDSHLGHLFHDGPPPTGLRYCINSAALRFIPKSELEKEGYGKYLKLFKNR